LCRPSPLPLAYEVEALATYRTRSTALPLTRIFYRLERRHGPTGRPFRQQVDQLGGAPLPAVNFFSCGTQTRQIFFSNTLQLSVNCGIFPAMTVKFHLPQFREPSVSLEGHEPHL
jgi:hypothetical protein